MHFFSIQMPVLSTFVSLEVKIYKIKNCKGSVPTPVADSSETQDQIGTCHWLKGTGNSKQPIMFSAALNEAGSNQNFVTSFIF